MLIKYGDGEQDEGRDSACAIALLERFIIVVALISPLSGCAVNECLGQPSQIYYSSFLCKMGQSRNEMFVDSDLLRRRTLDSRLI